MTPQEKAEELVLKYLRLQENGSFNWFHKTLAKQCAIIAVDEIIKALRKGLPEIGLGKGYWYSVRKEIKKL